jgi:hypothetical protein
MIYVREVGIFLGCKERLEVEDKVFEQENH